MVFRRFSKTERVIRKIERQKAKARKEREEAKQRAKVRAEIKPTKIEKVLKKPRRQTRMAIIQYQRIARTFYGLILFLLAITIVSTIIYLIFFPPIVTGILTSLGLEVGQVAFPEINSSTDWFGIIGFLLFIGIHIIVTFFFLTSIKTQRKDIAKIGQHSIVAGLITFGLFVFVGQFIFGIIEFVFGSTVVVSDVYQWGSGGSSAIIDPDIAFLNLVGFIILYNIVFLILILILRTPSTKKNKNKNAR